MMFASLCFLASSASSSPQQTAALICWCLLAVMATPFALPQSNMPNAVSLSSTELATGCAKSG